MLGAVVLGARVYLPALGRWLSPDPVGMGSPYVYVGDNPLTVTDEQLWVGAHLCVCPLCRVIGLSTWFIRADTQVCPYVAKGDQGKDLRAVETGSPGLSNQPMAGPE